MQRVQAGSHQGYEEETFCFGATPQGRRIVVVIRTTKEKTTASFGFGGYDIANYPCSECTDGKISLDCPEQDKELLRLILDLLRQSADQEENYKALLRQIGD